MAGPGREAAQIAALVRQQSCVAAVGFDEGEPGPVDDAATRMAARSPQPQVAAVSRDRHWRGMQLASQTTAESTTITPASQPLYLKSWATPTASPSRTALPAPGRSRNRWPWTSASTQTRRNETSVSAMRENAT